MRWAIWNSGPRLGEPVAVALLLALALPGCGPPPPNIVVITLDTLRRDHVGVYAGEQNLTPNLDALAERGLVHDAAFTSMPTTGPAHLSLFTGLLPSEHGSLQNGEPLAPAWTERDAALLLRARGYATAAFVTSRLVSRAALGLKGFEVYDAPRGVLRSSEDAARSAAKWLEVEDRRPVFLWLHLYDAHAPYGTRDEKGRSFPVDSARYGWVDPALYASAAARRDMVIRYQRGVRSADAALGIALRAAEAQLGPDLLVLVAADHGESLSEHLDSRGYGFDHGEFLDPECVSIPLVVRGPGVEPGRSSGAVSIRDLYTTLLKAGGVPEPALGPSERRDLRRASSRRRVVEIERRRFKRAVSPLVRDQLAAATDGHALAVVGEDAATHSASSELPSELIERARARSALRRGSARAPEIQPALREALRSLGYAE